MILTLGASNNLLDDLMTNYSQWHTERAPTGKKVNCVEEVSSSLSDKIDMLASLLANKESIDPNNVTLNYLVVNENDQVDVNFIARNNFNNSAYKIILVVTTISHILIIIMEIRTRILMAILTKILKVPPLILRTCLKILFLHKKFSIKLLRKSLKN